MKPHLFVIFFDCFLKGQWPNYFFFDKYIYILYCIYIYTLKYIHIELFKRREVMSCSGL
jgi:hypothetical protein